VASAELAWYGSQTGDMLFRPHTTVAAVNAWYDAVGGPDRLWHRWFVSYPRMMILPNIHFGLHSVFALVLAGTALLYRRISTTTLLLLVWAIVPFLYLNFGTAGGQLSRCRQRVASRGQSLRSWLPWAY
jgi:hypothetical protein